MREQQLRRISAAVQWRAAFRAAPVALPFRPMRFLAVLVAVAVAIGATVVVAPQRRDVRSSRPDASARAAQGEALPAPDVALPRTAGALAATLTGTTRRLRAAIGRWDATGAVPRGVTLLALHQQRMLRLMTMRRALGDATLARLTPDLRVAARATVLARRDLAAIPRSPGRLPAVRVASAAPAAELRGYYGEAQRRFGLSWSVLAAINFVESAFGRIRSASEAGARGPMQFLSSTWRQYGMGGDINDPRDAVLGAANYLHRAGAPDNLDRALFAYNHSTRYVRAVRRFASRMRVDERTFLSYYAWQVYVRTPAGVRRLTGPGRD
jgi:membrane-bound lytic murein transglycosylase B